MTVDKVIRGVVTAGLGVGAAALFGVLGSQTAQAEPAPPPRPSSPAEIAKQDALDKTRAKDSPSTQVQREQGRQNAEKAKAESKKEAEPKKSAPKKEAEPKRNSSADDLKQDAKDKADAGDAGHPDRQAQRAEGRKNAEKAKSEQQEQNRHEDAKKAAPGAPDGFHQAMEDVDGSLDSVFDSVEKWSKDTKASDGVAKVGPRPRMIDDPGYDFRLAGAKAEQIAAGAVGAVTDTLRFLDTADQPEAGAAMDQAVADGVHKVVTDPGGAAKDVVDGVAATAKDVYEHPYYAGGYLAASVAGGGRGAVRGTPKVTPKTTPRVTPEAARPNTVAPRSEPAAPVARSGPGTTVRPTEPTAVPRTAQPGTAPRVAPRAENPAPARPLGKQAQQAKGKDVAGSPAVRLQADSPLPSGELLPAWRKNAPTLINEVAKRAEAKAKREAGYPPIPMTLDGKPYGPAMATGARTGQPKSMAERRAVHDAVTMRDGAYAARPKTKAQRIAFALAQALMAGKSVKLPPSS